MYRPRPLGRVIAITSALVAAGVSPTAAAAATPMVRLDQTPLTFTAVQDSYVNQSAPSTNYDNAGQLAVGAGPTRISYLQFQVGGLTTGVSRALLRLHVRNVSNGGSPVGGAVTRTGTGWSETGLTWLNRPATTGTPLGNLGPVSPNVWYTVDVTAAVAGNGTFSFAVSSTSTNGAYYDDRESGAYAPQLVVTAGSPTMNTVLLAAGDIASCGSDHSEQTAQIMDTQPDSTVLAIGDEVVSGAASEFRDCYGPTWGRHKARTRPVPGNHEYLTSGAAPYFAYFGSAADTPGRGWYSFDLAGWHIVALNSNCSEVGGCQAGSPQETWLRADLAAHPARCTLAFWHHPLFSSGGRQYPGMRPIFQDLYNAGAEIVLDGHAHQYERFAPQNPSGGLDSTRGIREFVVGTGGRGLQSDFPDLQPNSLVRNGTTWGVLQLTLRADGYDWRFRPIAGQTFTDSGSGTCH